MNKIYKTDDIIRVLIGDTLPTIKLEVLGINDKDEIVKTDVENVVLNWCKEGSTRFETEVMVLKSGVYEYTITNAITDEWSEGKYLYWFDITDNNGNNYRREGGVIKVEDPKKVSSYKVEDGE